MITVTDKAKLVIGLTSQFALVLNSLKIQISHRASVLSLVHIVPAIRLGSLGKCPVCASRKVNLIAFLQIPSGSVRVGQIGVFWKFHHDQTCPRAHRASSLGATSPASGRSRLASPARQSLFNNVEVDLCLAHFVFNLTHTHCNALKVPARETKARKLICF